MNIYGIGFFFGDKIEVVVLKFVGFYCGLLNLIKFLIGYCLIVVGVVEVIVIIL